MLVQQCQQTGIKMLEVPADWEQCFAAYPQVAVWIVPQRLDERSYRITGGKLRYSLRRGEDVPSDVLYCLAMAVANSPTGSEAAPLAVQLLLEPV